MLFTMNEIIKNNKLIASFMGGKISGETKPEIVRGFQNIWLPIHGVCRWDTVESGRGKILKYHNSWDWLIPVIDKIYSLDEYFVYKDAKCRQFFDGGISINTKYINETYNEVIDFIKWLNN